MNVTDTFTDELDQVKQSVHTYRDNLFPAHQRPMGHKHWTEKNLNARHE